MSEPIADAEIVKENLAVGPHTPENVQQSKVTPAQARVEAVADLIKIAMPKAGTLQLTKEESAALLADFPDDCFQPGAGGKEHLIYIEHAALRDRFNQVLGLGQWAIIVRETWNEDFETKGSGGKPPQKGTRVYARAMLLVRGCYVAEAVGDMDYYPSNAAQNYGDAFEGAKSAAFRRCAKEFGVGLQAWRKDFGAGWKERRYTRLEKQHEAKLQPEPIPKASTSGDKPLKDRIEALASWLTEQLGPDAAYAAPYLRTHTTDGGEKSSALLPNEELKDLTATALDGIKADPKGFLARLKAFAKTQDQIPGAEVPEKKIEVPRDADLTEQNPDWWREVAIHFGPNQGTRLGDLETKTIFGWWKNWTPSEDQGTSEDVRLRRAIDAAGAHYAFK